MVLHPRRSAKVPEHDDPRAGARRRRRRRRFFSTHFFSLFFFSFVRIERKKNTRPAITFFSPFILPLFPFSNRWRLREQSIALLHRACVRSPGTHHGVKSSNSDSRRRRQRQCRGGDGAATTPTTATARATTPPIASVLNHPGRPRRRARAPEGPPAAAPARPGPLCHAVLDRGDAGGQRVDPGREEVREKRRICFFFHFFYLG